MAPISGRSLMGAARAFCDHINQVLHQTVTQAPLICRETLEGTADLSFRDRGIPKGPTLETRYGPAEFVISQFCGSHVTNGKHLLQTVSYRYAITPEGHTDSLFRWDYERVRGREEDRWCRHHFQGQLVVPWGDPPLKLNDVHLPTGYVAIEDVIRFCIVDLGVQPLLDGWHEVLDESYERFKREFVLDF